MYDDNVIFRVLITISEKPLYTLQTAKTDIVSRRFFLLSSSEGLPPPGLLLRTAGIPAEQIHAVVSDG